MAKQNVRLDPVKLSEDVRCGDDVTLFVYEEAVPIKEVVIDVYKRQSLHFEASAKLFSQLAPTQTTRLYLLDAEIRKAGLDADLHHAATALASLLALKEKVSSIEPSVVVIRYYNALGRCV